MAESSDLSPDVMRAIESGRKIEAIILLRAERGIDLKEAKTIIDQEVVDHRAANPDFEERSRAGSLSPVIAFVVLAAILYFVFSKIF